MKKLSLSTVFTFFLFNLLVGQESQRPHFLEPEQLLFEGSATSSKNEIELVENSSILTRYDIADPGILEFEVCEARISDNWTLKIAYSEDKRNWFEIKEFVRAQNGRNPDSIKNFVSINHFSINTLGKYYIKFFVSQYTSGRVYIKNIRLNEINSELKDRIENDIKLNKTIAELDQKIRKNEEAAFNTVQSQANLLKQFYKNRLRDYSVILHAANQIEILYDVTNFAFKRANMSNPTQYDDFNIIIKKLKEKSDSIDQVFLDQLTSGFKVPEPEPIKDNKFSTFFRIAYQVGDAFTGGRFSSITNTIKSLFAKSFSQSQMIINHISDPNKKIKDKVLLDEVSLMDIKKRSSEAKQEFIKLNAFLSISESDYQRTSRIANQIQDNSNNLKDFYENTTKHLESYFKDFGIAFDQATIDSISTFNNSFIEKKIDDHFERNFTSLNLQKFKGVAPI